MNSREYSIPKADFYLYIFMIVSMTIVLCLLTYTISYRKGVDEGFCRGLGYETHDDISFIGDREIVRCVSNKDINWFDIDSRDIVVFEKFNEQKVDISE